MAQKRDGARLCVPLGDGIRCEAEGAADRAVEIERILSRLAEQDPRKSRVVELRIFEGMEFSEIARHLDVSVITVKRDWQFCRAWLRSVLA
jgi:RNA polymerase sigma factor (sigma-70 family)